MTMTCDPQELSETPRRFTRIYYQTDHRMGDVLAPGYFDPAIGMLRRYDTIEVWAGGGAGRRFDELVVTQIDPGATPPEGRVTVRPLSEFRHERIRSNRKRRKPANKGDS